MGSLETQFDHDAHRGLMEASIGFPDMPMGSVLSRIQEGLHLLLHDPFSFLLFPCSRPGPSISPSLVRFVFFFHFFLNFFKKKSLEFLHMVFAFPAKELVSMFTNIYLAVSGISCGMWETRYILWDPSLLQVRS